MKFEPIYAYYIFMLFDHTFRFTTPNDTFYKVDVTNYFKELLFYDAS